MGSPVPSSIPTQGLKFFMSRIKPRDYTPSSQRDPPDNYLELESRGSGLLVGTVSYNTQTYQPTVQTIFRLADHCFAERL